MSAPPGPQPPRPQPTPGQHKVSLTEVELAHQVASTFAAGAMAALAAQLPASALDPTFADPSLQKLILVGWGAYKTAYAGLLAALKDPSWGTPEGVAQAPAPPQPSAPNLGGLIAAVSAKAP